MKIAIVGMKEKIREIMLMIRIISSLRKFMKGLRRIRINRTMLRISTSKVLINMNNLFKGKRNIMGRIYK